MKPKTLADLLRRSAEMYGSKPAISMHINYRMRTLTYSELYVAAQKTASWLEQKGIMPGETILMNAPSSPNAVVALFGVILRGAIFVPLNTQSTKEMIRNIKTSCDAKLLFSHSRAYKDEDLDMDTVNIDTLLQTIDDLNPELYQPASSGAEDVVQIMYTSGTTGEPKGVVLSHKNMLTTTLAIVQNVRMGPKDKMLSILPLSHIYEQVVGLFAPLYAGSHIIYLHRPSALIFLLKEHKITKMAGVPEFLRILMSKIEQTAENSGDNKALERLLSLNSKIPSMFVRRLLARKVHKQLGGHIQLVASGGSPLDVTLEQKWNNLGIRLLQGYGLTEVSGVATMNTAYSHKEKSVGKPLNEVSLVLSEDGEICLKGASVFSGYYKRQDATNDVLKEGIFLTGDIGEIDSDGFLFIKGRKKYMLKGGGGQNIYPEDIESELDEESEVIDSCVVASESGDHMLITAVIRTENHKTDINSLRDRVNKRLAGYQAVNQILVWPEHDFPRSATHKVKRDPVQKWAQKVSNGQNINTSTIRGTALTRLLAGVTTMEMSRIHPESKLVADLALDSLMRVEIVSRIELEFGVLIEETAINNETTVTELEDLIKSTKPTSIKEPFVRWPLSWWAYMLRTFLIAPILNFTSNIFFITTAHGKEKLINIKGPCLIMPNHKTGADSITIARTLPKHLARNLSHAAGADINLFHEYGKWTWLIRLWLHVFALPRVEGSKISDGLNYVGWMLDQKQSVCIFPEGETKNDNTILPIKDGAALFATQMSVPVIPVFITNMENVMQPHTLEIIGYFKKVDVWFGDPMYFEPTDSIEDTRLRIAAALGHLRQQALKND